MIIAIKEIAPTSHFQLSEFTCPCGCGFVRINPDLIRVLEQIRRHFRTPVLINSGCRCPKHNLSVGGVAHSKHLTGAAADIMIRGVKPALIYHFLEGFYPTSLGLGLYAHFVHVDVRGDEMGRWSSY